MLHVATMSENCQHQRRIDKDTTCHNNKEIPTLGLINTPCLQLFLLFPETPSVKSGLTGVPYLADNIGSSALSLCKT